MLYLFWRKFLFPSTEIFFKWPWVLISLAASNTITFPSAKMPCFTGLKSCIANCGIVKFYPIKVL